MKIIVAETHANLLEPYCSMSYLVKDIFFFLSKRYDILMDMSWGFVINMQSLIRLKEMQELTGSSGHPLCVSTESLILLFRDKSNHKCYKILLGSNSANK